MWSYVGFSCDPVYISQKSQLVRYMWVQMYIFWFTLQVNRNANCFSRSRSRSIYVGSVYRSMQKIINVGFNGSVYILIEVQIDSLNLGTDLDLLVDFPRE